MFRRQGLDSAQEIENVEGNSTDDSLKTASLLFSGGMYTSLSVAFFQSILPNINANDIAKIAEFQIDSNRLAIMSNQVSLGLTSIVAGFWANGQREAFGSAVCNFIAAAHTIALANMLQEQQNMPSSLSFLTASLSLTSLYATMKLSTEGLLYLRKLARQRQTTNTADQQHNHLNVRLA